MRAPQFNVRREARKKIRAFGIGIGDDCLCDCADEDDRPVMGEGICASEL
jgi:hypothetical protein